jgi:DNA ligase-1
VETFARLLEALAFDSGRNAKLRLIGGWLADTPDPCRGWGLAALAGTLHLPAVRPALLRALIEARVDPLLFRLSYDYVGDLAETIALLWPDSAPGDPPSLDEVVQQLAAAVRADVPAVVEGFMDRLDVLGRFALVKLATGALRVGAGARLVRQALALQFGLPLEAIEEEWHGLQPPYATLFAWAEGRGPRPATPPGARLRPFMLAHPLPDIGTLDLAAHAVEWKWDGIRLQAAFEQGERRLFSRDGNDVSASFPDLLPALPQGLVLDGELLVRGDDGRPAPFAVLQQRLNRKAPPSALVARAPVFLRCYDLLAEDGVDLRPLPFEARRQRLEVLAAAFPPERIDLSPLVAVGDWETLAALRDRPPDPAIEGLMLKRRDGPYGAGRVAGQWWKWKKAPRLADCVLMYAQRGHGRRSGLYSDFTFGCWGADGQLLPVGKAYFGFTDQELGWLDRWVKGHTLARFGPVREVEKALVLEIAFEGLAESGRHKSGLAMRFPRIARIRTDKPAAEAETIAGLRRLGGLDGGHPLS